MYETIAMILAGGQGSRLSILSDHRAKPAVPFGGIYRIIDFTMSNVMHAKIPVVGILTQYKPYSLMAHISTGEAWGFTGRKHHAKILPPYVGEADSDWYGGTADAVYQNLGFIDRFDPDYVFVLSGDHIYKMDYNELLEFHMSKNADLTIATQEVPWEDVHRFGIAVTDGEQRITDFIEKSKTAPSNLASLGIYLFNRNIILEKLINLQPLRVTTNARVRHSIISPGCVIEGEVYDSVLSPGVHVKSGAKVEKSIIMNESIIGEDSRVIYSILDKNTVIGKNCKIGIGESVSNKESPHILSCGISVFGKNASLPDGFVVGKNCLVYPVVEGSDYPGEVISSGETIRPKCKRKIKIR
ncbi:MAG: sugar phosphate nucleotidyltransferase [Candidatus Sumerlaeota bacterium]|nr:sugar phosphate nucleotidyltransferase [Candidatus Sumerlaeota bacterium]